MRLRGNEIPLTIVKGYALPAFIYWLNCQLHLRKGGIELASFINFLPPLCRRTCHARNKNEVVIGGTKDVDFVI
jgi:hypothetical protein